MKEIEIPFGAKDSELKGWEYTIPEGMEAEIKDGKIVVREKKPALTDFEQSVYDLCPVLGIEEAKATASDLLELAKKTLLKTGKVVLASNYPEGCSFEDGFHLGYNEGFNAKQKEQKPEDRFEEAREKYQVEWSEEDEEALDMCLDAIPKKWKTKSGILLTKWLKDNIHLQSKQEWSEEDEHRREGVVEWLRDHQKTIDRNSNNQAYESIESLISWLKSIRPQPNTVSVENATKFGNLEYELGVKDGIQHAKNHQWKPTEEQMDILSQAAEAFSLEDNEEDAETLASLYNDLKKLM